MVAAQPLFSWLRTGNSTRWIMLRHARWLVLFCVVLSLAGLGASIPALDPPAAAAANANCTPGLFQSEQACQPGSKGPSASAAATPAPQISGYVDQTIWS